MEENDDNIKVVHEDLVNTVEKEDTEENMEFEENEEENKKGKVKKKKKAKKVKKPIELSLGTATLLLVSIIISVIFITIAFGMITIRKMKRNNALEIKNIINSSKSTIVQIEKEM